MALPALLYAEQQCSRAADMTLLSLSASDAEPHVEADSATMVDATMAVQRGAPTPWYMAIRYYSAKSEPPPAPVE